MKFSLAAIVLSGLISFSAFAADSTSTNTSASQPTASSQQVSASAKVGSQETGKAAGIDTAFAASAGGITATVLAVGAAAVVIGVALSDSGGGDDPAPPVTQAQ
ncbi:hypothetical protein RJ45_22115 [Photobacterium gaetbulicola]|uniref:Uncharacterized protein n=2 Tax=Photobacterium gaetbulicola TaxID=1295392 RepID=A0A0B9GY84_9GAMM|nr:hypothetical protein RJ45_22115 [Photobacterium gaetbulicola]